VTPALALYLAASRLAPPALRLLLSRRARRGKEDPSRLGERWGAASSARPAGRLIWLHGASVGEGMAAAALAAAMGARRADLSFLLTTGTVASAALLAGRLPPRALHQFAPLDAAPWVARFLDHWRPDLCVRVDSELWPATMVAAASCAPLALVNARISERSLRGWRWAPGMARALMARCALILPQEADGGARWVALGADPARVGPAAPIKAAAPPPDADPEALAGLRAATAGRPVWLAASTHAPEEALALDAHRAAGLPDLLTLVAPRHPARGPEIAAAARAAGLTVALRSAGERPAGAQVYVADTLGEMGLWYRLAPFAFVGGSIAPAGGHNPYEPAALGVALAHGPHVANFAEAYAALGGAARPVSDAASLAAAIRWALGPDGGPTEAARAAGAAAAAALAPDPAPLDRAAKALLALLDGGR
jgi:3-deoxy-D-manno-octulosonic-acid transferase